MTTLELIPDPGPVAGGGSESVWIRAVRSTDADGLQHFYSGLSQEARRKRFLHVCRGPSPSECAVFCTTDHDHREGFVAIDRGHPGGERIVGHLCLEPDGAGSAEVAIAVADE